MSSIVVGNLTIDFSAVGNDEIRQNVKVILTTPVGTVPFDRKFGVDLSLLDKPINITKTLLTVEYIKKIQQYEPRVRVESVSFTHNATNGEFYPKVVLSVVSD
jgi:phage baseplate assembly protein W